MKKLVFILVLIAVLAISYSQAPNAFNYQAILRNSDGIVKADETISLQISIVNNQGVSAYLEIHNTHTNKYGLVNVVIGQGTSSNDLLEVDWTKGPYFIDVTVNGVNIGSSPLLSVPYALHAYSAESLTEDINEADPVFTNWDKDYDDLTNQPLIIGDLITDANGKVITNLANPSNPQDAVTKDYVTISVSITGDTLFLGNEQWIIIPGVSAANAEETDKVTDIDGNEYGIITIGSQKWLDKNLKTTKYSDGTDIPLEESSFIWEGLTGPAYCWYENDQSNFGSIYGALYNWYAVSPTTSWGKNVCPTGWHVPTDAEWATLINFLGGKDIAGGKLKESALDHWISPNEGAINEFGFTALPGGRRYTDGTFDLISKIGCWWSSTENDIEIGWGRQLSFNSSGVGKYGLGKVAGFSVRCIKD